MIFKKILDPLDFKGIKNAYINYYIKYYLRRELQLNASDAILEIGCGVGRLVEYFLKYADKVYGIDLIDKFIDICTGNVTKNINTYL